MKNWPTLTHTEKDFREGDNIALKLGYPSGATTDADLDAPEAVAAGQSLLPQTGAVFGRKGKPRSHFLYECPDATTKKFTDIDGTMLMEIRSTGSYTVVPPSIHESGEEIAWATDGPPAKVSFDELYDSGRNVAIASMLARHWPKGARHETALAFGGYLARRGLSLSAIEAIVRAGATIAADEEVADRVRAARESAEKIHSGTANVTGAPTLKTLIGAPVVHRIDSWFPDGERPESGGATAAGDIIKTLDQEDHELFQSPEGYAYVTVSDERGALTMKILSDDFRDWLSHRHYQRTRRVPNANSTADALRSLSGRARYEGPTRDVFVRLARVGDTIWLDLGRPERDLVEVTSRGWKVVGSAGVKFRRSAGCLPLPLPVRSEGATLSQLLLRQLNVAGESDLVMATGWLVAAVRGKTPNLILCVNGEQGSAKTSACRVLRRVIDPSVLTVRIMPKDPRELAIMAHNGAVLAFDNVSHISDAISDALCSLSTGGGFSTRALFTDADESFFTGTRPVLLNGITDFVARPDLLDRTIVLTLAPIADHQRRTEKELDELFSQDHPAILAALLDAAACSLRNENATSVDGLPRMADVARWVIAAEPTLGWPEGTFLKSYRENIQSSVENVLDGDPIVVALIGLLSRSRQFKGSLTELLAEVPPGRFRPESAKGLGHALRRKAPALRKIGIEVEMGRSNGRKFVQIRATDAFVPNKFDDLGEE